MLTATVDTAGMLEFALEEARSGKPVNVSNQGDSFHSRFDVMHRLPGAERLAVTVAALSDELGHSGSLKAWAWVNLLRRGGSNKAHDHPSAKFAAVLYLTGGSDIVVEDGERVAPEPGKLIVFDARARHWVEEHQGDDPRVSIVLSLFDGEMDMSSLAPPYLIGGGDG